MEHAADTAGAWGACPPHPHVVQDGEIEDPQAVEGSGFGAPDRSPVGCCVCQALGCVGERVDALAWPSHHSLANRAGQLVRCDAPFE